jgi:hypothetical protein
MNPRWMIIIFSNLLFLLSYVILEFSYRGDLDKLILQIQKINRLNGNLESKNKHMTHILNQLGDSTCYLRLEAEQFKTLDLSLKLDEMYVESAKCVSQDRDIMTLQMRNTETESECGL